MTPARWDSCLVDFIGRKTDSRVGFRSRGHRTPSRVKGAPRVIVRIDDIGRGRDLLRLGHAGGFQRSIRRRACPLASLGHPAQRLGLEFCVTRAFASAAAHFKKLRYSAMQQIEVCELRQQASR